MIRKFFSVIAFCIFINTVFSQTNVSGLISTNTTWSSANSPYIVTGVVLVNSGITLTIDPGVTVKFDTGTSLQINGELIARGISSNRIIFTSNQASPAEGDWGNIYFNDVSIDATADVNGNYLSGSIIEYALIEWGGKNVKGLLQTQKAFPYISNCMIKHGKSDGIYSFFGVSSGGPFYILNNTIAFNKSYGIYIDDRGAVVIKGNLIYSNCAGVNLMNAGQWMISPLIFKYNILANNGDGTSMPSVFTWTQSEVDILNNSFINNKSNYILYPITHYQRGANIKNNTFYSNNAEMLVLYDYPHLFNNNNLMYNHCTYYLGNQSSVTAAEDATNNWWGTINNSEISLKIYDWNDNNSLQIINYQPFLSSPDTNAPISPPTGLLKDTLNNNLIVKWNKNTESDLAGYKVYYGTFDGIFFSNFIDVGTDTTYTLPGAGLTDLVLVTAYDNLKDNINDMTEGHESWYSNDVLPEAKITNGDSIEICQNEKIILRANKNESYTYQWLKNSIPIQGATADTCEVSVSGNYKVVVSNATNNSDTSNLFLVEIHQLSLQNGNNTIVCGGSITLSPSITYIGDNPISYTWAADPTLSATNIQNPLANPVTSHIYYLSVTDNVCSTNATFNVTVNPLTANAGSDKSLICGGSAQLDNVTSNYTGAGILTYHWSPATGLNYDTVPNPMVTITSNVKYYVTITTPNGCSATDSVAVTVNPFTVTGTDDNIICGGSIILNTSTNYTGIGSLTYSWLPVTGLDSSDVANPVATINADQTYTVTVSTFNGCSATDNVNISIIPMDAPEICLVGVDSTNKNVIVWNKPVPSAIDSIYIYKETGTTNVYAKIGSVSNDSLSVYVDLSSQPDVQSGKYKISIFDDCSFESAKSDYHKTMHLTINQGVGTTWNLIWEQYEGFTVSSYKIYRGTTPDTLQLIGTVLGGNTQYSDLTPPAGYIFYQIEVVSPNNCNPSKSYNFSRSNIATNKPAGIDESNNASGKFSIYPNPAKEKLIIGFTAISGKYPLLEIYSLDGQLLRKIIIAQQLTEIDISGLSAGAYIIKAVNGKDISEKLFMKE
jgi:hypothetical protein